MINARNTVAKEMAETLKDLGVRYSEVSHMNEIYQLREAKKDVYKPSVDLLKGELALD